MPLGSVKGLKVHELAPASSDRGTVRLEFDWGHDMHVARVEV
jgi:hypothetical protein